MGKPYEIPFTGYSARYDGTAFKDERLINCFRIKDGNKQYFIKRPGFASYITPATGKSAYGCIAWTGLNETTLMTAYDSPSTVYKVVTNVITPTSTSVGAVSGAIQTMSETIVGSNYPTITVTCDDSTAWYYDNGSTVAFMTKIADADFPGNASLTLAGGFAHMNGYAFIMDTTGKIWNSDLNSITSWTATSFISANEWADVGKCCVKFRNYIIGFGAYSMEFFQNAGTATGSPLLNVPSMAQKVGTTNYEAVTEIGGTLFFVGKTLEAGTVSLYKFDGSVSRVSTDAIDVILSVTAQHKINGFRHGGRSFIFITGMGGGYNDLMYCVEENEWFEWLSSTSSPYHCGAARTGQSGYEIYFVGTTGDVSGKLFKFARTPVFQDDGSTMTITIQSAHDDMGTSNRKFYGDLSVQADIASSSSPLTVNASDDDGANYNTIGSVDLSNNFPLFRTGASVPSHGNKRSWQFIHSANHQIRINKFQFPDVRLGTK